MGRDVPRLTKLLVLAVVAAPGLALVDGCSSEDGSGGPSSSPSPETDGGSQGDVTTYPPLPPYEVDDSPLPADYALYDHAKECFDRFRVAVPEFDCDGPDSSRLKIEVNGTEVQDRIPTKCDKPSLAGTDFACVPGARLTRFTDLNMYGHTIATVIACRRSAYSALDSGKFDNIAVLQADLANNEACWFQIRKDASFVGRKIPSPYEEGRVKGDAADQAASAVYVSPVKLTSDHTECYRCHDNQVWLRTPWISTSNQVAGSAGHTNEIPRPPGQPTFLGHAYHAWNHPANRPTQIQIDATALDQDAPPTAAQASAIQAGKMAPSDACTQCHTIAKSSIAGAGQGTCNEFARFWMPEKPASFAGTVLGSKLSTTGTSFPGDAWMPPTAVLSFQDDATFRAFYARAFEAIQICCDDPTRPGCVP